MMMINVRGFRSGIRAGFLAAGLIAMAACSDSPTAPSLQPAKVEVASDKTTLNSFGQTVHVTAVVTDRSGNQLTNAETEWEVDDPSILTMEEPGIFRATGNGQAVVTARVRGAAFDDPNLSSSVVIVVEQEVAGLGVESSRETLRAIGQDARLTAFLVDALGHRVEGATLEGAVTWQSADPDIARVDANALLVAAGEGTAEIQATANGLAGTFRIDVAPRSRLSVCVSSDAVAAGEGPMCARATFVIRTAGNEDYQPAQ